MPCPKCPQNSSKLANIFLDLVGATAIKKAVCYDSSPALHIAEARVVECPSGPSPAEFLMVFLTLEVLFIGGFAICGTSKKTLCPVAL